MRYDPELAAAGELTGPHAREVLQAAVESEGLTVLDVAVRGALYYPGRSITVDYDVTVAGPDGTRADVLLVAHERAKGPPEGATVVAAGKLRVAVWRFPNDPYLTGLAPATHPGRVRVLLDSLGAPPGAVRIRTRSYRPSRRAVVEVALTDGEATGRILYIKVLRSPGRADHLADVHRQLRAHGLPVPAVHGVARRQGLVVLEALGGTTLRQRLVEGPTPPPVERILELQQALAGVPLDSTAEPQGFADPRRHVDLLQRLLPHQAARIDRLAEAATVEVTDRPVTVHGDLYDAQLLVDDERVTGVIDVDGAGPGLLVQDCANLIVHLEALAMLEDGAAARILDYSRRLAAAHAELVDPGLLRTVVAATWFGLATGPFRAQEPDWERGTIRRLDRIESWLRAGPTG